MLDPVSGGEGGRTAASHKTSSLLQLLTPSTLITFHTEHIPHYTTLHKSLGDSKPFFSTSTPLSGCTYAVVSASGPSGPSILQLTLYRCQHQASSMALSSQNPSRVNGGALRKGTLWLSCWGVAELLLAGCCGFAENSSLQEWAPASLDSKETRG